MKKDTYSVGIIGFGHDELMALGSVFELSSRRIPKFIKHASENTPPDILLVDADDESARSQLADKNASRSIPAILIGESNHGTAWPVLPRPIRWVKLFHAFDVAVSPSAPQAPAAGVTPALTQTPSGTGSAPSPAVGAQTPNVQVVAAPSEADWVLVVDDNQTVREFMKSKLAAFNFNVDYAESGEQAIGFTGQKNYACIFLDVVMPGIDGYQVCKLIKSNRTGKKTAVVMLTSKDSPFDKIRGSMSGCDAYLTKPVDEEKLLETISRFLKK